MEADKYFEKIEAYLRGELTAEEAEGFRVEVEANAELKAALLRHRLADRAIELAQDDYLREKMQQIQSKYGPLARPETRVVGLRQWMARAAAILLLVVAGTWGYGYLNYSDRALLRDYYEQAASPGTARGEAEADQWFAQGLYLYYQEKDYAAALESFMAVEPGSENEPAARYFIAHCQLKTDQPAAALTAFDQMLREETIPPFAEREEVAWSKVLCYLDMKEDENAEAALNDILQQKDYSEAIKTKARALLQDLNSFWRRSFF